MENLFCGSGHIHDSSISIFKISVICLNWFMIWTGHKKIIGDRKSGILRSKTDACGNIVK